MNLAAPVTWRQVFVLALAAYWVYIAFRHEEEPSEDA